MTEEKDFITLGRIKLAISQIVRDPRGVEDLVREAVEEDWAEQRYTRFDLKIFPFPDAFDMAEWDRFLLDRYPPMHTDPQNTCSDCPLGPCSLEAARGKCGLELGPYKAKLSLRQACRGCFSQMMDSRDLLNYAIKVHGRGKEVSFGQFVDKNDLTSIRLVTGMDHKNLGDLDRAQSYAEEQLTKLLTASFTGVGSVDDFEELAFHAGSILFVTQNVAELVKVSAFTFTNAGKEEITELYNYPRANRRTGLGSVDRSKPVLAFIGDSFLPSWVALNLLREKGLHEQVELCGIGPAGDDGIRFYPDFRNLGPMLQGPKIIRSGIADVVVAGTACIPLDILGDAQRVQTKVIWTGRDQSLGLMDRIDDPIEDIVKDLVAGAPAAWIRDPEKAAKVAVEVVQQVKRKGGYILSDSEVKAEAGKCRDDCDLCFTVCPNSLLLNKAVKAAKKEGTKALCEVEKGCYLCRKCEEACPEKIRLLDMLVAAQELRAPEDQAVMRAGRGTGTRNEAGAFAYTLAQAGGWNYVFGCGDAHIDDIAWIVNELVSWAFIVWVAGCAAVQAARYFDEIAQKHIFRLYPAEAMPRNLINCGACSATSLVADAYLKWARLGAYASCYGNISESADVMHCLWYPSAIIWGALPERMYTVAAALVRLGVPTIVGPASGFDWKRFMLSDRWDWQKWWGYDVLEHRKKTIEPNRKHMLIPVETKEEALMMTAATAFWAGAPAGASGQKLEFYVGCSERFWGQWPDDWNKFIRSPLDFGTRQKARMIKRLGEEFGWEVYRTSVSKAKHPDGRLMGFKELHPEFSATDGRVLTMLPHRVRKEPLKLEGGKE